MLPIIIYLLKKCNSMMCLVSSMVDMDLILLPFSQINFFCIYEWSLVSEYTDRNLFIQSSFDLFYFFLHHCCMYFFPKFIQEKNQVFFKLKLNQIHGHVYLHKYYFSLKINLPIHLKLFFLCIVAFICSHFTFKNL